MLRTLSSFCVYIVLLPVGTASAADPPKLQYEFGDLKVALPTADEPKAARLDVGKALRYLNDGDVAWSGQRKCVSCHTNGTYMTLMPAMSAQLGEPNPKSREFFVETLKAKQETAASTLQKGTTPEQIIQIAAGLAEWDRHVTKKLSPETDAALRLMFSIQRESGTWRALDCWPPSESDEYHPATVAAMAVGTAPGWLESIAGDAELTAGVERLKKYLRETPPLHDYARVLLLWASTRLPDLLDGARRSELIAELGAKQRDDGGWSIRNFAEPQQWGKGNRADKLRAEPEFKTTPSDGHMTGLAIVVLREAGVPKNDPRIARGIAWLKTHQQAGGRWWTRSLNTDTYHFIGYSATALPLRALSLCDELPAMRDGE